MLTAKTGHDAQKKMHPFLRNSKLCKRFEPYYYFCRTMHTKEIPANMEILTTSHRLDWHRQLDRLQTGFWETYFAGQS